ncbi:putative membrane protein [Rhodococcus phage E3]|uniref:hypothetical protein n=1 Tax=Rhodococcus phage E3 TaxID=1007869 RepID=UPI0002C6A391|nr:hypothetical protein M176_gp009 [Rhodococcus phage E3]AEQ20919.1 putative membrane protein [Rhodococcus phage E3]
MLQGIVIYLAFGVAWGGVVAWQITDKKQQAKLRENAEKIRRDRLWSEGGMPTPSAESLSKAVEWITVVDAVMLWPISMFLRARKAWKKHSEK